jgi:hypothetical protein
VRGTRFVSLLAATLLASVALPTAAAAIRPAGPLVPSDGALFGAFVDMGVTSWHREEVSEFEQLAGRTLDVDHRYYSWNDAFPGEDERWDFDQGRIPMLTWEPWETTLSSIASGESDTLIRERAVGLRDLGQPLFLRFAHEMNGNWYPWDGFHNNDRGKRNGPAKYVAAWRHVHDLFEAEGADNVVWVWCPNRNSFPAAGWNGFQRYYPGDAYVDWVCIDGYNFGANGWSSWRSFASIVRPIYDAYAEIKPIMIGETGSSELGGAKAEWMAEARASVATEFPSIAAFLWFNIDKNGNDWRVNSSDSALRAYREFAADRYFNVKQSLDSAAALAPAVPPTVTGSPELGSLLTATPGDWAAETQPTFSYQWHRCNARGATCRPIPGAVDQEYLVGRVDLGRTIRMVVSATNEAGTTVTAASPHLGRVLGPLKIVHLKVRHRVSFRAARISFRLTRRAVVSVEIRNSSGRVVRHKAQAVRGPGRVHLRWRGRADWGARVPSGRYRVVVVANPAGRARTVVGVPRRSVAFVYRP